MTAVATEIQPADDGAGNEPGFRPVGHPVAAFVVAVAGVAFLLWLAWWAALMAPRMTVHVADLTHDPTNLSLNGWDLRLTNDGPLGVNVVAVGFSRSGMRAIDPVRLGPRETTVVHLAATEGDCPNQRLGVLVRSPIGVERSTTVRGLRVAGWCPA